MIKFDSRVCVVGDLHFRPNNLVEAHILVDQIVANIPDDIELVVLLGDILDNHANVHSQAYNVACLLIEQISSRHPVFILVGNHDYINNSQFCTQEHPFNAFKKWCNVRVVDTPCHYYNRRNNETFVFVPYVPPGRFIEAVSKVPEWSKATCVFAHQEFSGIIFKEQGDVWPTDYPPVISGHIHDRMYLQKNILYIGTPVQHSFAENTDKGLSVFGNNLEERRLPLGLPVKQTISTSVSELDSVDIPLENANIRLMLRTNTSEWQAFRKTKRFKELVAAKVKIIPVPEDQQNTQQLKSMAKQRRTYMNALEDSVSKGNQYMKQAFENVMKAVG
jgi:DNA repair exonuclease SbcCD nuclease subunit